MFSTPVVPVCRRGFMDSGTTLSAFVDTIDMVTPNVVNGCYNIVYCQMTISCQRTND
jgi:hypothetical protein